MAVIFYVIRHWNSQKRIQGQADIPLNDLGREEAHQMAKKLQDVSFSFCISSDLLRCTETAALCQKGPIKSDKRFTKVSQLMFRPES